MKKTSKYRLFVGKTAEIPEDVEFSFYSGAGGYTLLYSNRKKIDGYDVVPDKIVGTLNTDERTWLLRAKNKVMKRFLQDNRTEIADFLNQFMSLFESELENIDKQKESRGE